MRPGNMAIIVGMNSSNAAAEGQKGLGPPPGGYGSDNSPFGGTRWGSFIADRPARLPIVPYITLAVKKQGKNSGNVQNIIPEKSRSQGKHY